MLDFKPTTTVAALLANNTSASDSFPGWLPGLAKAANTSQVNIDIPQKKLVHRCDWWGYGNHPDIGIHSNDPVYCAKTADAMQAQGFDGCFLDWYGPGSNEDKSLLALKPELEKRGMVFSLVVDSGTHTIKSATTDAARTTALLNVLSYARTTYFSSSSYLRQNSKPVVLFFGFSTSGFDWTKIRAAMADSLLIFRWEMNPQYSDRFYADGYFGWTNNTEAWIANVKSHAPGKSIVLGVNGRFNNTDPVLCPWGVGKNKIIDAQGGMTLQNNLAVARNHPEILLSTFNTWNDYQEKSAVEMGIPSGASLSLGLSANTLAWNDAGAAFDHYDVYFSQGGTGTDLMKIATTNVTQLNLALFDLAVGDYKFFVQAVGKPLVQNVLSAPATLTLGWR